MPRVMVYVGRLDGPAPKTFLVVSMVRVVGFDQAVCSDARLRSQEAPDTLCCCADVDLDATGQRERGVSLRDCGGVHVVVRTLRRIRHRSASEAPPQTAQKNTSAPLR